MTDTHAERWRAAIPVSRPPRLSLKRNFMWTLGGNVIYAGCQWAIIVLLAKIARPELVGQFALASAVAIPITFLANFQLRVLFVTDTADKYSFREMLGLRLILCCLSLAAILITCAIAGYEKSTTLIIVAVGLAQLIDCVSDTYYAKFQRDERMDRISISLIIRNVLSATVFTLLVYQTHILLYGACGLVLGRGLVFLFYDIRSTEPAFGAYINVNSGRPERAPLSQLLRSAWNFQRQRQMLWVALPLAIVSILVSVNSYMPRYVLESYLGRRELGIYSAINYIPTGCFMVTTALGYAIFARLTKLFSAGKLTEYKLLLFRFAGICLILGVLGFLGSVFAGRQVLSIIYKPEYAQHVDLLRWLMVVGAIQCLTTSMSAGLTAASEFRVQVPLLVGVAAVSLAGCMILVPRMGLIGAALAIVISSVVQLCASASLVFRTMLRRAKKFNDSVPVPFQPTIEVGS